MKEKVLITGGAGFIGSHLARRLLEEGKSVVVYDDLSTGKESNLEDIRQEIEFVAGDIRDAEAIRKAACRVECIFHQAALASVPRSISEPRRTHDVNINGTFNVLMAARDESVPRVVLASSSSVYGDTPTLPKVETMVPSPLSPYAAQKLTGELYAHQFHMHYGIATVCLRYFNVFGPSQDPDSPYAAVLPLFLKRIRNGQPPVINGDGSQSRDFTYIDNTVEANLLASCAEKVGGEVFNVATSDRITILELTQAVVEWTGWEEGIEYGPPRPGDIQHSYADVSKAEDLLGYKVLVEFREGLNRTLEWFSDHAPS